MNANRLSWVGVGIVVLVVALLAVRTVRRDGPAVEPVRPPATADPTGDVAARQPATSAAQRVPAGEKVPSAVHRVKQALADKGYYQGPIDGNFDPPVIEALKKFQKDAGMPPNGHLNQATYKALGVDVRVRPR